MQHRPAAIEPLELRQLLAATATLAGRTLTIVGTPYRDEVRFSSNGPLNVEITTVLGNGTESSATHAFTEGDVWRIEMYLGDGDDSTNHYSHYQGPKTRRAIIEGGPGNDFLTGSLGHDHFDGGPGDDWLLGGDANDTLIGGLGRDTIEGGAGDDHARGDGGNDSILGQAGVDRLYGGDGVDRLYGGAGKDRLSGDAGDDFLFGGGSSDRLYGGAGNDRLIGEGGDNHLDGGEGADSGNRRNRRVMNVLESIETLV